MTIFERICIEDPKTQEEVKNPYYGCIAAPGAAERIWREFGLSGPSSHIKNSREIS